MVLGWWGIACPKSQLCFGEERRTDSHPYIAKPTCKEVTRDLEVFLSVMNGTYVYTQCYIKNHFRRPVYDPYHKSAIRATYVRNCVLLRLYVCGYFVGLDSSVGIATTLRAERSRDRIPVGARFSAPVQTGPGAQPASYTVDTGSFFRR
jgi:hypothetical protein